MVMAFHCHGFLSGGGYLDVCILGIHLWMSGSRGKVGPNCLKYILLY